MAQRLLFVAALLALTQIRCRGSSATPAGGEVDAGGTRDAGGADAAADAGAVPDSGVALSDGGVRIIRVYVAGESIERRNRFVAPPFLANGALNPRDGGNERNDNDEYGWMIPLADRVALRDAGVRLVFVGTESWLDADDQPFTGTYPPGDAGMTSAISGTAIPDWLGQRQTELTSRTHCYDIAFAARGGNDWGTGDTEFKSQIQELIALLLRGSSCQANPIVYVTGHMPDDNRSGPGQSDLDYGNEQAAKYAARVQAAVQEFDGGPSARVRFVDMFTPFRTNQPTTAFPSEVWADAGRLSYDKIVRDGDRMHVRRLSSIYAGEIVADALDLAEIRALP